MLVSQLARKVLSSATLRHIAGPSQQNTQKEVSVVFLQCWQRREEQIVTPLPNSKYNRNINVLSIFFRDHPTKASQMSLSRVALLSWQAVCFV